MLQNQIDTFLFELMGKRFSSHFHFVSVAHYISNKVSCLIRPLHELFGEETTDADKLVWLDGVAAKVSENDSVMDQLRHNDIEQIMLGDYPQAVQNAVIESMGAFEKHSVAYLSDKGVVR